MRIATLKTTALLFIASICAIAPAQRFTPVQDHGIWWLQDQAGHKIFSFGVCVVDTGTPWKDNDPTNPSYGAYKFYDDPKAWAQDTVSRLQDWSFNTIGAWSSYDTLLAAPNNQMYMTPISHMGSSAGFPWLDMWDPANVKVCDDICREQVAALKKDKRIIGYFSDNEMGWWRNALFKWIWDQKTNNTRNRVVDMLIQRYGSWQKMLADWDPDNASSFDDLRKHGKIYMRPGSNGIGLVKDVLGMLAERYYSLCREIIKKYDPDALYLGDRYISNYYPEVAEQAGKYCDVVSTNLNPNWSDGGYVRFHLDDLEKLTHKPLMITEYYMTAIENRSGDKDNSSGFPVVKTQTERATGFTNATLDFAHNPNLVGAHWFQYYDEAQNGRGDGENYDFGLVDTSNKPYEEVTAAAKAMHTADEHAKAAPKAVQDSVVPQTPAAAFDLAQWDKDKAFVPSTDDLPRGDMYASWSPNGLTVAFYWYEDLFADELFRDKKVPDQERSTVELTFPNGLHWKVRLTDKSAEIVKGPKWNFEIKVDASSHLILTIPPSAFKVASLKANQKVSLDAKIISECRAYTTNWRLNRKLEN
ncbi:MAG TPA: hypothetical protein VGL56_04675 [Fimbriimonadaceae bacterium]